LRLWREEPDLAHVLAVKSSEPLWGLSPEGPRPVPAAALAAGVPADRWQRLSAGNGAKGPRLDDGTRVRIRPFSDPERGYWLLVRRSLSDPTDLASYVCSGPQDTTVEEVVRVAGVRWTIAECLEAAKGEVGLDHDAVRRWVGWYRHVTLAFLAHASLAVTRRYAQAEAKKGAA